MKGDESTRRKQTDQQPAQLQQPVPSGRNGRVLLWALLAGIFFYLIYNFYSSADRVTIPYSVFKAEVRKDNVDGVTIRGTRIRGTFKTAYTDTAAAGNGASYSHFTTVKPPMEDDELLSLLEAHDATVSAKQQQTSWLPYALIFLLPWILIIGYAVYIQRKMQGQSKGGMPGGGMFGIGQSRAKKFKGSKTKTSYDDVAGSKNAKQDLREIVHYLQDPGKFTRLGASIPKGVLLMGPPGTGKTLLARATAGEAGVPFFSISGSEFIEMLVGVGASRVRNLFEQAKKESPAIIFIDEIDSIGRSRGTGLGGGHDEREQTLNQILGEMDGFEPHESVVVVAATNRPDILDPALTRPGRFDRQITLDLPKKEARRDILAIHTKNMPFDDGVDLENIAARTVGFSGADLQNLANEAALLAGRKNRATIRPEDFDEASDKILLGAKRDEKITEDEKKIIAWHEAGHALTAKLLPGTDPLQKVTIIARGKSLGATEQVPEIDRHNLSRSYLMDRICVALGGRASEKLIFDELTNGAAADLKNVTTIARKMVCQWGMSERLGAVTFKLGEDHVFLGREMTQQKDFSEHTARVIDEEIRTIIHDMEEKAIQILSENEDKLRKLADRLLEEETLENDEVEKLLNGD